MPTITRELHGLPEETLREYLIQLGGAVQPQGQITGPGWTASITRLPDYRLGQASFCSCLVEMDGEAEALRDAWRRFELRFLRPGG